MGKIENNLEDIIDYEEVLTEDAETVIVTLVQLHVLALIRAINLLREEGIKVGMIILKTIWPFPGKSYRRNFTTAKI